MPGDRIRAYDFPGHKEYYIEGEITAIDRTRDPVMLTVKCDTDTKYGAPMKGDDKVLVPVVGSFNSIWGFDRIEKLTKK